MSNSYPKAKFDSTWYFHPKAFPIAFENDPERKAWREALEEEHHQNIRCSAQTPEGFFKQLLAWRQRLESACEAYLQQDTRGRWSDLGAPSDSAQLDVRESSPEVPLDGAESEKIDPWPDAKKISDRYIELKSWLRKKKVRQKQILVDGSLESEAQALQRRAEWLGEVKEAWHVLSTLPNQVQALELVAQAVAHEALPELYYGPSFWQNTKRQRAKTYKNLERARAKAITATQEAHSVVKAYYRALWAMRDVSQQTDEGFFAYLGYIPPNSDDYDVPMDELDTALIEMKSALERMKQRVKHPTPFAPQSDPATRRGRRIKPALSAAVQELSSLFSSSPSRRRAEHHCHTLLYVAGVWPNPDPDSMTGKFLPPQ